MVRTSQQLLILIFALLSIGANGIFSISADGLGMVANIHPEYRIQIQEYQQLKQLPSLRNEFSKQFQNISITDIEVPSTQDMQCLEDMQRLMQGLKTTELWALRMIDSWGTLPSGILYGNFIDIGNYKECIRINKEIRETHRLRGKHCFAKIPLVQGQSIDIGICFPSSCTAAHMNIVLGKLIKQQLNVDYTGQLVDAESCHTGESKPLDGITIFTIVLLSIFAGFAVLATLWDYFVCQDQKQLPQLVKIFSIRATSRAVFRVTVTKSNPNVIECLHGIRCMSLIWIIFGHEYMTKKLWPNLNRIDMINWLGRPFASFILQAFFAVDTYLFLGGFLLFMSFLRSLEKTKGKLNVPLMYLNRYLRLTPMLAVAILVYVNILPLIVEGPLIEEGFDDFSRCKRTWYLTLLYVQNYATREACLAHSWYLAVDMQLYIISPLLLFALYKWGKKAAIGIAILIVLLTVWLFTLMMINEYSMFKKNTNRKGSIFKIYFATHQHATPWLIGALFGYFLHVIRGKSSKLSPLIIWAGWTISLTVFFTSIFALYPYYKWDASELSILEDSLYYSLTRIAWPLSLCWVIFACMQGYGSLANSFLSSPLWQPLSRLSYAVYVFHLFIVELNARRVQTNTYFSDYDMMLFFWSDFGFSVLLAYALHVVIEAPLAGLINMLLSIFKDKPKPAENKSLPVIKQNLAAAELGSQMEAAPKA